jgi:hypothetical protein
MRLAVVVAFAAVLAGCGSATGSSLEEAADATGAETSRVDMVYRTDATDNEKEFVFSSTGLFDYPGERAVMTTSDPVPFYGEDVQLKEIRLIGQTVYWRWVLKGKTHWVKQSPVRKSGDPAELLIPGPGTPTKPTDVLARVLLASEGKEELGKEDIRGEETTHYRARVNLKVLVKQVPANERPPDELMQQFGGPVVPVDLWIDGDSRLRKIVIVRPKTAEGRGPGLTTTVELYDYGVDVDVQAPEGELISEDEFNELTGEWVTGTVESEGGEGEVCEPQETCRGDKKP